MTPNPLIKVERLEPAPEQIEQSPSSRAIQNIRAKTAAGILWVTLSLWVAQWAAQESVQYPDASSWVEWTVSRIFDWLPTTVEEMNDWVEMRRVISKVSQQRQDGLEFYGPYLEEFNTLSQQWQYEVALLIYAENSQGWPDYPQDTIDLVQNLRLPESMIEAILGEAEANGADQDWDIPAFREVLIELREAWETASGDTFNDLVSYSPENIAKIYFVYAVNNSILREQESILREQESIAEYNQAIAARDALEAAVNAMNRD